MPKTAQGSKVSTKIKATAPRCAWRQTPFCCGIAELGNINDEYLFPKDSRGIMEWIRSQKYDPVDSKIALRGQIPNGTLVMFTVNREHFNVGRWVENIKAAGGKVLFNHEWESRDHKSPLTTVIFTVDFKGVTNEAYFE